MMVYVNGQDIARLVVGVIHQGAWQVDPEVFATRPEEYLSRLEDFLRRHNLAKTELTGFVVVTGPGSATALRMSLALVNTLAFALGVPVIPVDRPAAVADIAILDQLSARSSRAFVLPTYEHDPKITTSTRDALKRKTV